MTCASHMTKVQSLFLPEMWRSSIYAITVGFILTESIALSKSLKAEADSRVNGNRGTNMDVHCSRERSRAAWRIIDEYLIPFVEKQKYNISRECRLHPDNDMFREQEQHKTHLDYNEWQCGFCKKKFHEEKFLDRHLDNRHYNLVNNSQGRCLADLCSALHCDQVLQPKSSRKKCSPAAALRNRHLCEGVAKSCFPPHLGPLSSKVHEFFLHQFCEAHDCTSRQKPFSRGGKAETSLIYLVFSFLTVMAMAVFYVIYFIYRRALRSTVQHLRRSSQVRHKKKAF